MKHILRSLAKAPAFTITAAITLALGIGICTAMFSVIDCVMLRPLPVRDQDRLMVLWQTNPARNIKQFTQSVPNFFDYRDRSSSFSGMFASAALSANLVSGRQALRLEGEQVSQGFLAVMGWKPLLGRGFLPEEDHPGARRVALISERCWRDTFNRDPKIVGTRIVVNGEPHEIVGVLGREASFIQSTDIWRPLALGPKSDVRDDHFLTVIGRLKPGVTPAQAESELKTIAATFPETYPSYAGWSVRLESLYDVLVPPPVRRALVLLFVAVGLVLLIACANVANLLLARALTRQRETSVRLALGASARHVFARAFSEAALLAIGGTIGGILIALWTVEIVRALLPPDLLRADLIAVDGPSLAFAAVACAGVTLLSGVIPALRSVRADPAAALHGGTRTVGDTPGRQRVRATLVVAQFALCSILLVGASLLIKSFARLQRVDPGFTATGLLSFKLSPDQSRYGDEQPRLGLFDRIGEQLRTLPGVTDVAFTSGLPLDPTGRTSLNVFPQGSRAIPPGQSVQTQWRIVSADYFATLHIPIVAGRAFTRFDTNRTEPAIIISQRLARQLWPGENAVGKRLDPGGNGKLRTVVGVVGDTNVGYIAGDDWPAMYLPLAQWWGWNEMTVVLRANTAPEALAPAVRNAMHAIDPAQPIFDLKTMNRIVSAQLQPARLNSSLLATFAALALVLAAVGIYGMMAAGVAQRRNEIGVRMALGAQIADIMRLVFGQGLRLAVIGLALGLGLAFAGTRFISSLLFKTSAADPLAYLATIALLGLTAFLACWIPARRAATINPIEALRTE
jgi:putative ABC transport system permease protein